MTLRTGLFVAGSSLLLIGAAPRPSLEPGLWRVQTLAQGEAKPLVASICVSPARADKGLAAFPDLFAPCRLAAERGPGKIDAPGVCPGGGSIRVSGVLTDSTFDLAVQRTGRIGASPPVTTAVMMQGKRIAGAC